jgi:hypothetical protein
MRKYPFQIENTPSKNVIMRKIMVMVKMELLKDIKYLWNTNYHNERQNCEIIKMKRLIKLIGYGRTTIQMYSIWG